MPKKTLFTALHDKILLIAVVLSHLFFGFVNLWTLLNIVGKVRVFLLLTCMYVDMT